MRRGSLMSARAIATVVAPRPMVRGRCSIRWPGPASLRGRAPWTPLWRRHSRHPPANRYFPAHPTPKQMISLKIKPTFSCGTDNRLRKSCQFWPSKSICPALGESKPPNRWSKCSYQPEAPALRQNQRPRSNCLRTRLTLPKGVTLAEPFRLRKVPFSLLT